MILQINRDWVLKLDEYGPDGLIDRKAPGQPALLDDAHRAALRHLAAIFAKCSLVAMPHCWSTR